MSFRKLLTNITKPIPFQPLQSSLPPTPSITLLKIGILFFPHHNCFYMRVCMYMCACKYKLLSPFLVVCMSMISGLISLH